MAVPNYKEVLLQKIKTNTHIPYSLFPAESELEGDMWRIYDYVTRHFIATLSRDCKYLSTTITFAVGSETFYYTGNTLVDAGYTEIMHWQV